VCGAELQGRQAVACSERCRAIRWRQRQAATQDARDRKIRGLLEAALQRLGS